MEKVNVTFYWKNHSGKLEVVEVQHYNSSRSMAFVKRIENDTYATLPVADLIVITDIEKSYNSLVG